jgi:hypothetical protein
LARDLIFFVVAFLLPLRRPFRLHFFFLRLKVQILRLDFDSFLTDIETQMRENSHINIRDPDQGEQGNHVSAPIGVEQFEARDHQKQRCNVVTKAVFAREQIEKLALPESSGRLTLLLAIVSGLAEHVFVSDRPCNGGDGNREQQKPEKLDRQGRHSGSMRGLQSRLGTIRCISARARLAADSSRDL